MKRVALCLIATGCNLYFSADSDSPGGAVPAVAIARPCVRAIAAGTNLPGRTELVVASGCADTDTVEELQLDGKTLDPVMSRTVLGVTYRGFVFGDIADDPGIETIGLAMGTSGSYVEWATGATTVPQRAELSGPIADLTVGDADGDGRTDVVVAVGRDILAALSRPGKLPAGDDMRALVTGHPFFAVRLAPLPDGRPGLYYVALGNGANETGIAHRVSIDPPAYAIDRAVPLPAGRFQPGGAVQPLQVADVDGDGKPDVIGAAQRVFVWSSRTGDVSVLDDEALGIGVGDVDGDGLAEPVYLTADRAHVREVIVATDGTLRSVPLIDAHGDAIAVGDFDGDGQAEIAVVDGIGVARSTVAVYHL